MKQKPMQEKTQELKILQPAVVFKRNTAPSKHDIFESRKDPDYQVKFVKTTPNDSQDDFDIQTTEACSFPNEVLTKILTTGANPIYREILESNANKYCASNIKTMQNSAVNAATDKLKIALEQNANYCVADAVGCLVSVLSKLSPKSDNAIEMINNTFSISGNIMIGRFYPTSYDYYGDCSKYISMLGEAANIGTDKAFDDACILVYNDVVTNVFSNISSHAKEATSLVNRIMYSKESKLSLDDASNCIKTFSAILTTALLDVSDVIQQNAYAFLNDIILISQTLYGNAEFNSGCSISCDDGFMYTEF